MLVAACEQHKGRTDDRGGEERLLRGAGTPDVKTNHSVGLERECGSLQGTEQERGQIHYGKGCLRSGACADCQEAMRRRPREK